jgi:LytS/YehU family sensor histidine kinase
MWARVMVALFMGLVAGVICALIGWVTDVSHLWIVVAIGGLAGFVASFVVKDGST